MKTKLSLSLITLVVATGVFAENNESLVSVPFIKYEINDNDANVYIKYDMNNYDNKKFSQKIACVFEGIKSVTYTENNIEKTYSNPEGYAVEGQFYFSSKGDNWNHFENNFHQFHVDEKGYIRVKTIISEDPFAREYVTCFYTSDDAKFNYV